MNVKLWFMYTLTRSDAPAMGVSTSGVGSVSDLLHELRVADLLDVKVV